MLQLLDSDSLNTSVIDKKNVSKYYQTIGEVRRDYGLNADGKYNEIEMMEELLKNIKRSELKFFESLFSRQTL